MKDETHPVMALILFDSGAHKYSASPDEAIADLEEAIRLDRGFTRAYMVVGHYKYLLVQFLYIYSFNFKMFAFIIIACATFKQILLLY